MVGLCRTNFCVSLCETAVVCYVNDSGLPGRVNGFISCCCFTESFSQSVSLFRKLWCLLLVCGTLMYREWDGRGRVGVREGVRERGKRVQSRSVNVSYGIVNLAFDFLSFPLFSLEKPRVALQR